jgi:hypothetical protein
MRRLYQRQKPGVSIFDFGIWEVPKLTKGHKNFSLKNSMVFGFSQLG